MAPLQIRSLYLKVVIPIVALVLAAMGLVSFFAMRAMGEGVRLVAEERARYGLAFTRSSVEDVEHVMLAEHGGSLQNALERLGRSPDMDAVRILSASGKVLYSSKPAEVGQMMPGHVPMLSASAEQRTQPVDRGAASRSHSRGWPGHQQAALRAVPRRGSRYPGLHRRRHQPLAPERGDEDLGRDGGNGDDRCSSRSSPSASH